MVQLIAGSKGKGKTKYLIEKANESVKTNHGTVVYLDKNNKHMYELSNRIRLINVSDYPVTNYDMFLGFICGMLSQDHDLETFYLDSFFNIAQVTEDYVEYVLKEIDLISRSFDVDFVISLSLDEEELPEEFRKNVIVSL
ncbi:MAG: twitching motility protein PilT [Lachnospiraceae bacterium]|nr:twitching motility protein PilT [Lachnospiraceae bacterium]